MDQIKPKRSILTFLYEVLLLAAGAYLYALAFPSIWSDTGWPAFALVALIPVLYVINRSPWSLVWLYGLLFGLGFYSLFNYWLSTFHQLAIYICGIAKGLELMLVFPVLKLAFKCNKRFGYIIQSFVYVTYTFICQSGFFGYAYGQLGSAFYSVLPMIQIADLTGIWGISFLVFLPQAFMASWLINEESLKPVKQSKLWIDVLVIGGLWIFDIVYGLFTIAYYQRTEPEKVVKVAAVQHNSDTWKGGYTQYLHNFQLLTELTTQAMEEDPDLIIWSETAFVPSVEWHTNYPSHHATSIMVDDFVSFGKSLGVPLITGNPEGVIEDPSKPAIGDGGSWNRVDYNSVILFGDGKIMDTYRKQHLVPFTEYFPYQDLMPKFTEFLRSHDFQWWLQGDESKVFNYDGFKFSTSICFEDIFGGISRDFVKAGSDLLLNLSNDSWSGAIPAQMQHMALGVFRSVENKRSTVRSTNSGMTVHIAPWGETIDMMEPFTSGYEIYDVGIYSKEEYGNTLYTLLGDWFAYFSMILSILGITASLLFKRKKAQ